MSGVISAPWHEFFQGLVARASDLNEARRSRAGIDPMEADGVSVDKKPIVNVVSGLTPVSTEELAKMGVEWDGKNLLAKPYARYMDAETDAEFALSPEQARSFLNLAYVGSANPDAANEPDPLAAENAQLRDLIDAQEAQIMALRQSLDIALARIAEMVDPPPTLKMADPIHRALTVGTVSRGR